MSAVELTAETVCTTPSQHYQALRAVVRGPNSTGRFDEYLAGLTDAVRSDLERLVRAPDPAILCVANTAPLVSLTTDISSQYKLGHAVAEMFAVAFRYQGWILHGEGNVSQKWLDAGRDLNVPVEGIQDRVLSAVDRRGAGTEMVIDLRTERPLVMAARRDRRKPALAKKG